MQYTGVDVVCHKQQSTNLVILKEWKLVSKFVYLFGITSLCGVDIVLVVCSDLQANSNCYTLPFFIPEVIDPNIGQVVLTCKGNKVLARQKHAVAPNYFETLRLEELF